MRALPLFLLLAMPLSGQEVVKPYKHEASLGGFAIYDTDRLTQIRTVMTQPTLVAGVGRSGLPGISLAWGLRATPLGDTTWTVGVSYKGDEWAFIGGGEGPLIQFLADGQQITVPSITTPDRDVDSPRRSGSSSRVKVEEFVVGQISAAALFQIARADSVFWQVSGSEQRLQGDAMPESFERLRRFLATAFPDSTLLEKKCSGRRRDRCT
jgi:hypothetical protein